MRIDGFTCCVGTMYAGQLARALPIWHQTLDSFTIVTKRGDVDVLALGELYPIDWLRIVETNVFTLHGAHFNKGAALNVAYAHMLPKDWVLHVDSDIIPPENWREIAERRARRDCLSGAFRYDELTGKRLDEEPLYPYGYFHLWHVTAPQTLKWPLFENHHAHAGSYDANFTDLWPRQLRSDLGFKVIHQGERRTHWFGPGADPKHMRNMMRVGPRRMRMLTKQGRNRLAIPEPRISRHVSAESVGMGIQFLHSTIAAVPNDPFALEMSVSLTHACTT